MADNTIGSAYVQIIPSADGISGSIGKVLGPEASSAGVVAGRKVSSSMVSTMKSVGVGMMKAGAVASALAVPLVAGINKALSAYEVQMAAETKLTEIYKTRMGASEDAAKATMEYASALQQLGVVGDEVTLSGAQQLATFLQYPETVNALLPAMDNLLVQQNGLNATSQDAVNIANLMGKAMQGNTGALRRVGITFDEAQEAVLKYGTEEERAAMLAEVINQNVGNMNETMAETPLGKIQQMKNSMGDLKEEVGAALAPVISDLAQKVSKSLVPALEKFVGFMQQHPVIAKFVVGLTAMLAIGGPLLLILGGIVSAVAALIPVVTAIATPVLVAVGIVTAIVAALKLAYSQSESFRKAVSQLAQVLQGIFHSALEIIRPVLQMIWQLIKQIGSALGTILTPVVKVATAALQVFGKYMQTVASVILPPLKAGFTALGKVIQTIASIISKVANTVIGAAKSIAKALNFSGLISKVSQTFHDIKEKITGPIETARQTVHDAIEKVKGFFPITLGKIFSGIKLPHFKVYGGKAPWGIAGYGEKPKIDIEWYKKAEMQPYMFRGATLFGAGERNDEILYGRSALLKDIASVAGGDEITINVYGTEGMSVTELAKAVEERLIASQKRRRLAWQ